MNAMVPAGSSTNDNTASPMNQPTRRRGAPVAPADPVDRDDDRQDLQIRGQRDRPRRSERDEECDRDLCLADRQAPGDGRGQPAGHDPCPPVAKPEADERPDEQHDEEGLPDEGGRLVWQESQGRKAIASNGG